MKMLWIVLVIMGWVTCVVAEEFPSPTNYDVSQLTGEIKRVVPTLDGLDEEKPRNVVNVRRLGGSAFTETERTAIRAAFAAHLPKPPAPDAGAELDAAIQSATTLEELKNALRGKTRQGRVKAERP